MYLMFYLLVEERQPIDIDVKINIYPFLKERATDRC